MIPRSLDVLRRRGALLSDVPTQQGGGRVHWGSPLSWRASPHTEGRKSRMEQNGWASSRHGLKNPSFPSDPNALAGDPATANPTAHDKALVTRRRRPGATEAHVHGHPHPASHCASAPLPADASRCVRAQKFHS